MQKYDRRVVIAPKWMENFRCIAGACPETCCRQWNIDVDPVHAESYTHLGDPELQKVMGHLLHKFRLRRPGMREPEMQYRLMLTNFPEQRCPMLNENGECRLQKKYGSDILCDTCYFHPRTFFQINEQTFLSACLSCPECARLALLHREPTSFTQFETEIDPGCEWLETSLAADPDTRLLLQNRTLLTETLIKLLTNREDPFPQRLCSAFSFLELLSKTEHPDTDSISSAPLAAKQHPALPDIFNDPMSVYAAVFDPISEALEKPAQAAAMFTRKLAGGADDFLQLLRENYEKGNRIAELFLNENEYLIENFMVHCVFSDSFRQFYRYQSEDLSFREILRHESALLSVWYLFLRILLAVSALTEHCMNEDIFLQTVIHAERLYWHYPDWFARCAERSLSVLPYFR